MKSSQKVICPRAMDYQLHYASPSQVEKYGMCRKCRAEIKKNGKSLLAGKVELPVAFDQHHQRPDLGNHIAFEAPGEAIQTTDFNFDDVDKALGLIKETPPDAKQVAAELFSKILNWCFAARGQSLKAAAGKFAVVAAGLRPDLVNDLTFEQIGAQLDITKQAVSKNAVLFQQAFGFTFARCRSAEARQAMARSQIGHKPTFTGKRNTPGGKGRGA